METHKDTNTFRKTYVCKCNASRCVGDFMQVVDLKNSGLQIYVPTNQESTELKSTNKKIKDLFVLHNNSNKQLTRPEYIKELCQYRTNCVQCKAIIKRVHNLLDEITDIQLDEVLSVCQFCKTLNSAGNCKRCEYLVHKFKSAKAKEQEDEKDNQNKTQQERIVSWVLKVNELLQEINKNKDEYTSILNKQPSCSLNEYANALQSVRLPVDSVDVCRPCANKFEKFDFSDVKIGGSGIESEHLSAQYLNDNLKSLEELLSCFCKEKDNNKGKISLNRPDKKPATAQKQENELTKKQTNKYKLPNLQKTKNEKKVKSKIICRKMPDIETNKDKRLIKREKHKALEPKTNISINIPKKKTGGAKNKNSLSVFTVKIESNRGLKAADEHLRHRLNVNVCESLRKAIGKHVDKTLSSNKMIKGTSIVPFAYNDDELLDKSALLYNMKHDIKDVEQPLVDDRSSSGLITSRDEVEKKSSLGNPIVTNAAPGNRFVYQLSNRDFIKNGWTILPTKKVLRVIKIYKMKPALPQYDWFKHNKKRKEVFYDTGEILAEIDDDGHGRWFYKNGDVALDFHSTEKVTHGGQRYVVYTRGDYIDVGGRKCSPKTVLASFDYLGNGVVYDMYGNERLKYNQFEGVLYDETIGPSTRWKWNSLNEPIELEEVLEDNYCTPLDPCFMEKIKVIPPDHHTPRYDDPDMLAIEFENYAKAHKAKTKHIFRNFKKFEIRMKALKINKNFSLRVCDQANIYLMFKDVPISLKLNVGMNLTDELIDVEKVDLSHVMTPYDHLPPLSQSIEDIQNRVEKAKRFAKLRAERTDRIVMPYIDSEVNNVHNDKDNGFTYCDKLSMKVSS